MKRIRSAIQVACLLAVCAGLPPVVSGCGSSEATSTGTGMPKLDPVQLKSAEEATAKANRERPKVKAHAQSKYN